MPGTQQAPHHFLVFGASGAIGSAICTAAKERGWRVTGVARHWSQQPASSIERLSHNPLAEGFDAGMLAKSAPFDAVCWAQGANQNDSVYDVDIVRHLDLYQANVVYILSTLKILLTEQLLSPAARMCVISSVWQNLARQSKLSYCVSKAALQGLILSASTDLAKDGHLINAVLPGALETPMTRRNLAPEQIDRLTQAVGFGRLPTLEDVSSIVCYLCSPENTGLTGQFIAADLGFSHVRIV